MRLDGKLVDLVKLAAEMTAAGVVHRGLGTFGEGVDVQLHTYDPGGAPIELPAGASAVVAAHAAPLPIVGYVGTARPEARVITTGTTPGELFRRTLALQTAYTAMVHLVGIDAGNGNMRYIRATLAAKRLNNGASLVNDVGGQPYRVLADHRDGAAGTWAITPSVSGNDFVLTVVGAAGRTVNWFVRLEVDSFTPGGQP